MSGFYSKNKSLSNEGRKILGFQKKYQTITILVL